MTANSLGMSTLDKNPQKQKCWKSFQTNLCNNVLKIMMGFHNILMKNYKGIHGRKKQTNQEQWKHNNSYLVEVNIDGLVQERHNSSALAMELRLSCINPSIWWIHYVQDVPYGIQDFGQHWFWSWLACCKALSSTSSLFVYSLKCKYCHIDDIFFIGWSRSCQNG